MSITQAPLSGGTDRAHRPAALRGMTGLPHVLWFLLWLAATLAAAAEGARLLIMRA